MLNVTALQTVSPRKVPVMGPLRPGRDQARAFGGAPRFGLAREGALTALRVHTGCVTFGSARLITAKSHGETATNTNVKLTKETP